MSEDQGGPPYLSRRYAYDGEGHQRAEAAYHMCGTFSSLHVFSYDGDGRLKEQLTYQFRSLGKRVYDYDGAGRRKAVVLYKKAVPQSTIQYRYDDQGRMIEQLELTPQGAAGSTTTYQYDQDRLATEHFTNRLDPSLNAISTYEYDAQGNWTRKTTRRSRGLREPRTQQLEVTDRVFEYF
jgi:hypothetical protein